MTIKNKSKVNDLHAELALILKGITNWKYPALAEPTLKKDFFKISLYTFRNELLLLVAGATVGFHAVTSLWIKIAIWNWLFPDAWANTLCYINDLNTNFSRIISFHRILALILIALGLTAHFHQWLNYYLLTKGYIKDPSLWYWKNQVRRKLFIPVINRRVKRL